MIHEIAPHKFDNQYKAITPTANSKLLIFCDNKLLVKNQLSYPLYSDLSECLSSYTYAFTIDETHYFLGILKGELALTCEDDTVYINLSSQSQLKYTLFNRIQLRDANPVYECLAGMTAFHLRTWYDSVKFCGKCGTKNQHHPKLRAMQCPNCNTMFFPKISPAIIVAVTHDDKLLLTKYAGRAGANYALVAGFIEIGETAEECVKREVMEEVGIHIKNVKYYDSQPWGYDGNLMLAYTAEADETEITLDENELATAVWLSRDEIPETSDHSSLTREIIRRFKRNQL